MGHSSINPPSGDLFGLKGVSFTAGLRLDYERMKMDYNSGTSLDYKVGIREK